jgi:DNA-binding HxlR family transcriptional regulator
MAGSGKKHPTGCAVAYGVDTFGDRWSLLVIRDLMLKGRETYGDFLAAGEGIATNVLADRLKHLESEGIVKKTRDPENGRRFLYALTEKGRDLAPIIIEIVRWSGKHDRKTTASRDLLRRIETDSEGLVAEIRSGASRQHPPM